MNTDKIYEVKDSSTIGKVVYNLQSNKLKVEFLNGSVYEYTNVDQNTFTELCNADSKGKFFNVNIKTKFQYSKLLLG